MSDAAPPSPSALAGPPLPTTPAAAPHCSECGWGTPSHKPHTALWLRLTFWLIPLAIIAVVGAMSFLAPQMPSRLWHATELIQPMVTRGDLREMAAGEVVTRQGERVALTSILLDEHVHDRFRFGDVRFQAMLVPPPHGTEISLFSLGWPISAAHRSVEQRYRNVVAREEPLAAASFVFKPGGSVGDFASENPAVFPRFDVSALGIFWTVAPERTRGKIVGYGVDWPSLIASLVIAAVGAWITHRLIGLALRKSRTHRGRKWPTLAATLVFLTILLMPRWQTRTSTSLGFTTPSAAPGASTLQPGAVLTGISVEQLRAFPTTVDADKALAADILSRLDDRPVDSADDVLLAGSCMEFMPMRTTYASPLALFAIGVERVMFERCPDFGLYEVVTMPSTASLRLERGTLSFLYASGDPGSPAQVIAVYFPGLLAAVGVSLLPGFILLAFHRRHTRRRAAKRERKNLCPSCAYPFPSLAAAPSARRAGELAHIASCKLIS